VLGEVEIPDGKGPALTGQLDSVESYKGFVYSSRKIQRSSVAVVILDNGPF